MHFHEAYVSPDIDGFTYRGDQRFTQDPSMENPIEYRGWWIYKWTGWKGLKAKRMYENPTDPRDICPKCQKPILQGQWVYLNHGYERFPHFKCSDMDDLIIGQWLACSRHPNSAFNSGTRFLYVSTPGRMGEYQRGSMFDISVQKRQRRCTLKTSPRILNLEREKGFARMMTLIDDMVTGGA